MQAIIRRKLATATGVMEFTRAHPSTDASYNVVVSRLAERLARADTLAIAEREGRVGEHQAVTRRDALRQEAYLQLRHLANVAEVAARTRPDLPGLFQAPPSRGPNKVFQTTAKSMLAAATAQKDVLVAEGLGESFVADLTKAVAEYDAASETVLVGRRGHIGARGELIEATIECMLLVGLLDGLNRARFRNDAESLSAWESVRSVHDGPHARKDETTVPPVGDSQQAA